jgi:hypothetical protein
MPAGSFAWMLGPTQVYDATIKPYLTTNSLVTISFWSTYATVVPQTHTIYYADCVVQLTSSCSATITAAIAYSPTVGENSNGVGPGCDLENWGSTPSSEYGPPNGYLVPQTLAQCASESTGAGLGFVATYDGPPGGIDSSNCTFNLSNSQVGNINWAAIRTVEIQNQALADDANCGGAGSISTWLNYLRAVIPIIRQSNPSIVIIADISLRDSNLATWEAAVSSVHGLGLTYLKLACPSNAPYCDTSTLQSALEYLNGSN